MLPRIKRTEFRNLHIDESVYTDNDVFLHAAGHEAVDATHHLSEEDFRRMLLHEPEIAIFGTGFKDKVKIDAAVMDAAKKNGVEIFAMPTPEAAKKFQELARRGKKVVAKLHVTC